jgi:hypothetical protein
VVRLLASHSYVLAKDFISETLPIERLYTFAAAFWRKYSAILRSMRLLVSPPGRAGHSKQEIKCFGIVLHFPLKEIEQCQCRYEMREKLQGLGISFLKSPRMANARMPQVYG